MLNEIKNKLPPSEKKIAEFILAQPHEAIHCTATRLGELSSTSSAAVIRLCKSLGLKGFQELKLRITGDLQKSSDIQYSNIEPGESQESIVKKVTNNGLQAITETTEMVNYESLSAAVKALQNADKMHFFGVGASGIIAQDAYQKFLRMNKAVSYFSDIHNAAMYIANVGKDDVVFGISFSGETFETLKMLELANERGATTISLTRYGNSSIAANADINLFISAAREVPAPFRSGATSSRLAQLHMIDILFVSVLTDQYDIASDYLKEISKAMNFLKSGR
ncbi:MurR/RpiR family transcriptional regulator [Salipaludibacillus aurantiacus]|uniref:DNA-binding transcriptional regulator, MurR/RpiR family, contains HTH and SIS domains n=1 Tax=Salipaludibacillus aurantiacus TaxID=1601833 RepID=A0A1H9WY85_9BACI|nr:MurR/RpiR family transcriptional regulator [Salipaludibacillus aurantiacus]SES38779.1 DNA-binding transcriptional regulator, MurR/RpiR family, contains HTH and SIS domains [Salipaludibacillus aurantiacus]